MTLRIGPDGRVLVPAGIRRQLGLRPGTVLVAHVEDDRLVLERRDAVLRRLQERFAVVPAGISLAEELIADRRREADHDTGT